MIKVLYIDNRLYGHNREIHVDFIDFLNKNKIFNIVGYGKGLYNLSFKHYSPNMREYKKQFLNILKKEKPNAILTYNRNGSSYSSGLDNISLYKWISESLRSVDLPKFHITTDYCRNGFRKEQAEWFDYIGYSAAIFRSKDALDFPININSYFLPFSIDSNYYNRYSISNPDKKNNLVGFLGTSNDSLSGLYSNRIAAIKFLESKKLLKSTKTINKDAKRKMLFGDSYIKFLTKNKFGLTCGGSPGYLTAKYFQIPAAKSMLICADANGLDLFPNDLYIKYSKNNLEEMFDSILYYIENKDEYWDKVTALNSFVINNHNHKKRGFELAEIIGKFL